MIARISRFFASPSARVVDLIGSQCVGSEREAAAEGDAQQDQREAWHKNTSMVTNSEPPR
jgi:hypothetical protein